MSSSNQAASTQQQTHTEDGRHVQQQQHQSKSVMGYFWSAREYLSPIKNKSEFLTKGILTPNEFIAAGDELIFRCPTWTWETPSDISKCKSYLPMNKQYLVTRNVPCTIRIATMEQQLGTNNNNQNNNNNNNSAEDIMDDDGEWLVSNIVTGKNWQDDDDDNDNDQQPGNTTNNMEDVYDDVDDDDFDIVDDDGEIVEKKKSNSKIDSTVAIGDNIRDEQRNLELSNDNNPDMNNNNNDDDEYADMDDYVDDNLLVDDDNVCIAESMKQQSQTTTSTSTGTGAKTSTKTKNNNGGNTKKVRTYDLSITYDNYYNTPRIWMSGQQEDVSGQQIYLSGKQMMEDVVSDYANRTVTIEQHPFCSGPHASIHPCKHGAVMKAIVQNLLRSSSSTSSSQQHSSSTSTMNPNTSSTNSSDSVQQQPPIQVEMYLFIFLKFVSSIIPTINYDFTINVTANTRKGGTLKN